MDLNHVFRRLVFAQVLLGIVAFCIAEQNPEMLLIAGALVALSWYVVEGPAGKPLPQWSILLGALLAVGWLLFEVGYLGATNAIVTLGHFTIWLQVLQLYGQKNNRDYTLLLVLSLLQMVGATVLSSSVVFGVMMIVYCVLALFTVLVFQFKSTSDLVFEAARQAAPPEAQVDRPQAVVGRGYRWQFRLLAILVGTLCGITAMVVFLLFPRLEQSPLDGQWLEEGLQKQVGFRASMQLGTGAPPQASREPVLHLKVSFSDSSREQEPLYYLRGAALDNYLAHTRTWTRSIPVGRADRKLAAEDGKYPLAPMPPLPANRLLGEVTLRAGETRHLFTLLPISFLEIAGGKTAMLGPYDLQVTTSQEVRGGGHWSYRFHSPLQWDAAFYHELEKQWGDSAADPAVPEGGLLDLQQYARGWPVQSAAIARLSLQILEQAELRRDTSALSDPNDGVIAETLANYLRENFTYRLASNAVPPREDPVAQFLFRQRQGHCEIFAASLAAMCRSIGMRARVVTGYLAHDYNRLGGYFVVRQSNAHAWTEVYTPDRGWITVDPTPPASLLAEHWHRRGWTAWTRELFEHFEYAWITNIIGYDRETRGAVVTSTVGSLRQQLTDPNRLTGKILAKIRAFLEDWRFDPLNTGILAAIVLAIGMAMLTLIRLWIIRRRRLVALQLTRLPRKQRRLLAKRLGFYLVMLDMLERHGFDRPSWQSPFSFAQELTRENPMRFEPVLALTEHFYEIRFGHRDLDSQRRRLIRVHLSRLEETLGSATT